MKNDQNKEFVKVSYQGIEAYSDTYAVENGVFKLLSLFGERVSVRAMWSTLFSGASVEVDGTKTSLNLEDSWKVSQKVLPSGSLQAVCFCKLLDLNRVQDEFLVIGENETEVGERMHLYLDRVSETPLYPEWCKWILDQAIYQGKARWLDSLNLSALIYRHDEKWLEGLVVDFLRSEKAVAV